METIEQAPPASVADGMAELDMLNGWFDDVNRRAAELQALQQRAPDLYGRQQFLKGWLMGQPALKATPVKKVARPAKKAVKAKPAPTKRTNVSKRPPRRK